MSKENSLSEWDKLWIEYNRSLKAWMGTFESLQRVTQDVQAKYAEVMATAIKISGDNVIGQFTEKWQKSITESGINTSKQFDDKWLRVFNQSAMDQVRTYGEMMNKFAETWQKMWNK
jgi:hypothetical protein